MRIMMKFILDTLKVERLQSQIIQNLGCKWTKGLKHDSQKSAKVTYVWGREILNALVHQVYESSSQNLSASFSTVFRCFVSP